MASQDHSPVLEEEESDINTKLILLVKPWPFIYDARDPRHKDRNVLERTWTYISRNINLSVEGESIFTSLVLLMFDRKEPF